MSVRFARRGARAAACALMLLHPPATWAVDLAVGLNIQERTDGIAPHCAALRRAAAVDTPSSYYGRGLCLLYGLGGTGRPDLGISALRRAASLDYEEAQMALADYFQTTSPARPDEALYWYERAERLGDSRAAARAESLKRKMALDAARPVSPPDTIVDPTPMELQDLYRQGYHCHNMSGEQWCHLANDF